MNDQIENELKLIEEIAKWAGDSCQMRQISVEEFDYASEFDMRMAQASQELVGAVGAIRIALDLTTPTGTSGALPELPLTCHVVRNGLVGIAFHAYSPEEMRQYALSAVLAERNAIAADYENQADDYINNCSMTEPDTGALIWQFGDAGRDYHSMLLELAEAIRART